MRKMLAALLCCTAFACQGPRGPFEEGCVMHLYDCDAGVGILCRYNVVPNWGCDDQLTCVVDPEPHSHSPDGGPRADCVAPAAH